MKDESQGLICPNCAGVVPVPEGARIVQCPFCDINALVQGERGVRRWQVARKVDREKALTAVNAYFRDIKKAPALRREAKIRDAFLAYLPYWRVDALVAGWIFGQVKKDDKKHKPKETHILKAMHWNDAALDVSEFGVHRVAIEHQQLLPYDADALHDEAMVFSPTESRTDAEAEAQEHFIYRGRTKESFTRRFFEKFHFLRQKLSMVYYPLWIVRYQYHQRIYQVIVDGVDGKVLYGKAPGNLYYRAAMLVGGLAAGNFILVNGTILAGLAVGESSDSDGLGFLLIPIALGFGLIAAGYKAFRYGEEVEDIQAESKKAKSSTKDANGDVGGLISVLLSGDSDGDLDDLLKTGGAILKSFNAPNQNS